MPACLSRGNLGHGHRLFLSHTMCKFGRGRHGGVEKGGGWKTSRMTPLPKRGVIGRGALVRYVFHPPQASVLCFSCTKIHDRADQKLFWRGPTIIRESAFSGTFSSPHTFCTPPYHGPTNGRGRFDGQTAGGHPKAFPRPNQPLFAVPALRELESACRVSIL